MSKPTRASSLGREEDGGDRVPLEERAVGYDNPKADWRTVRLTVDVLERFGNKNPIADTVEIGISGRDAERLPALRSALLAQPRLVMFLDDDSAVFDYDEDLYAIQPPPTNRPRSGPGPRGTTAPIRRKDAPTTAPEAPSPAGRAECRSSGSSP